MVEEGGPARVGDREAARAEDVRVRRRRRRRHGPCALLQREAEGIHGGGEAIGFRLDGVAEDNYQVSDQLRALEAAPVLGVPVLSQVEGDEQGGRRFSLSVDQRLTASVEEAP